jgi:hypothetical protein
MAARVYSGPWATWIPAFAGTTEKGTRRPPPAHAGQFSQARQLAGSSLLSYAGERLREIQDAPAMLLLISFRFLLRFECHERGQTAIVFAH